MSAKKKKGIFMLVLMVGSSLIGIIAYFLN